MNAHLELSIGSLVFEGVDLRSRAACAEAFTCEFELLARGSGLRAKTSADWRIPPLNLEVRPGDSPSLIGRALARSLHQALLQALTRATEVR